MEYKEFVYDFAVRTYENLRLIGRNVGLKGEGYEITQLINSLIGLLIFPQQEYFDNIPSDFPNEDIKQLFSEAKSTYPDDTIQKYNFMLKHLRNAIAHQELNVHPQHTATGSIKAFIFRDFYPPRSKQHKFEFSVLLSVEAIRVLIYEVLKFVCDIYQKPVPPPIEY